MKEEQLQSIITTKYEEIKIKEEELQIRFQEKMKKLNQKKNG